MSLPKPYYSSDKATIYCGDARVIVQLLGAADCLVTDPPWGLGELSGTISKERNRNAYESHDDTEDYVVTEVIPIIKCALEKSGGRGLVSSGVPCMWHYPRPRYVGGFFQPAAVGMSPWGFAGFNPVLFYGKDPRDGRGQSLVMTTLTERASNSEHPCAKPLSAMRWMVEKGSLSDEIILDPFAGSGTTGVACMMLGRRFIGIEIDRKYADVAVRRIREAEDAFALFEPPTKRTTPMLEFA